MYDLVFTSDANPMLLDGRQFVKKITPERLQELKI